MRRSSTIERMRSTSPTQPNQCLSEHVQFSRWDMDRWGHYWNFTTLSARRLFEESFPATTVMVKAYGNVLAAVALLHGLASQELQHEELDHHDPDYEVLITVRAVKDKAPTWQDELPS